MKTIFGIICLKNLSEREVFSTTKTKAGSYERWERVTRRWWFFVLAVLLQFIIPPYASKGFEWAQTGELVGHILQNSLMMGWFAVYPFFQVAAILFVLGVVFFRNRFVKIFSIYVALAYLLFAVGQNISVTDEYGTAVLNLNVVMFVIVAAFWFWEAFQGCNDFSARSRFLWRYWVVLPAFFAFWFPMNWSTLSPDFNPLYLFTSGSALTFCMMTPVFLAILTIYYPLVNRATLRVTALIGLIIGFYNMLVNFVFEPALWWNGVLHIPLVILSIYGLTLSLTRVKDEARTMLDLINAKADREVDEAN